jgi:hypothetical protein
MPNNSLQGTLRLSAARPLFIGFIWVGIDAKNKAGMINWLGQSLFAQKNSLRGHLQSHSKIPNKALHRKICLRFALWDCVPQPLMSNVSSLDLVRRFI